MTPSNLRAWQVHMGLTQLAAAQALGVSLATYKRWLVGEVPRLAELACSTLSARQAEWPEFEPWAEYVSMDIRKDSDGYYADGCTDMAHQAWEMAKNQRIPVVPPR